MKKRKKVEPRMKELVPDGGGAGNDETAQLDQRASGAALQKVVVNMGLSEARENAKVVDLAADEIAALTGQKAQVRRAKKAISNFKLREGMPIGVRVTLRASRMWDFWTGW
jgi:large subunit ribosomal protein L5